MKKNMFNVIKLMVIIPMILTTCNIGIYKIENAKAAKLVSKEFKTELANNDYQIEESIDEDIIVEDIVEEEPTPIIEENVYNDYDVMGEVNNDINYQPVEEEITPIVEEVVVTTYEPSNYNEQYIYDVVNLINQIRRENGLNELSIDYSLVQIANIRAEEITRLWSHTRPDGSDWWTIHQQFGLYGKFGENLAYGQEDPEEVVQAWMDSEGHRANILYPDYNRVGIAAYYYDDVYYWSQEFAG